MPVLRAVIADLERSLHSGPVRVFVVIELLAGAVFVLLRGAGTLSSVLLIWVGLSIVAFLAWWAGRHRCAHPQPDPVPGAPARVVFAGVTLIGLFAWGFGMIAGLVPVACGIGGWTWSALRAGGWRGAAGVLLRDPRPFLPLALLIALPRLALAGPGFLVAALAAMPSGIGQQLLLLVGLFAPLEAASGRSDLAAVIAAFAFGLLHVPFVLEANHGDLLAAIANAVIFQSSVGLIACLAYQRHRAPAALGIVHGLAIA